MSLQYCSITGEALQEPVVSKKSGHIFEKRIIEKQIQATGSCPITDQPLEISDLVPIKINQSIKPRPSNATSIPNMINLLQSEWDVVMLETYNLKQHLETVRQELSHALYQHDAACRVIARVVRERDESRKELAELYDKLGVKPETNGNQESTGLKQEICQEIEETALKLNKERKKNKKDPNFLQSFMPVEAVTSYTPIDTVALHSTTKPGITCSQIHPERDIIGTGGVDGSIILYEKQSQKILHTFEAHKKQVNDLVFVNYDQKIRVFSAGEDGLVQGFEYDTETKSHQQVYQKKYEKPVTAVAVLPIKYVVASACQDGTFSFHDARSNTELSTVTEYANLLQFKSLRIHPDGHFAALGTNNGQVIIWNIFQNNLVAELKDEGEGEINTIGFSENGYILASGSKQDGVVRIWDLRHSKCVKVFEDIVKPECVQYDQSATILAIVGETQIQLYDAKTYQSLGTTKAHKDKITSINFAQKTKYFVTVSQDRHMYIHSQ